MNKRYRYPQAIISHAVLLYHRFTLSFRDIEELLACRGIVVTYETIRQWCLLKARHYRLLGDRAFYQWAQITCTQNFKIA